MRLIEIDRGQYGGGDGRAINRHSCRTYRIEGTTKRLVLDRNLSIVPPHFEINGPYDDSFVGFTPVTKVDGQQLWGGGVSWNEAITLMCATIGAEACDGRT